MKDYWSIDNCNVSFSSHLFLRTFHNFTFFKFEDFRIRQTSLISFCDVQDNCISRTFLDIWIHSRLIYMLSESPHHKASHLISGCEDNFILWRSFKCRRFICQFQEVKCILIFKTELLESGVTNNIKNKIKSTIRTLHMVHLYTFYTWNWYTLG